MAQPFRRLRVLEIVAWNSTRGGAEKHVVDLLRTLPRDEFELALACTPGGNLPALAESFGLPWFPAPLFRARPDKGLRGLRRAIRTFEPDIIHVHGNRAMLYTVLVDRRSRRRLVYTHHGIAVAQTSRRRARLQAPLERLARRRVSRHITVSAADLEVAAALKLLDRNRATVVHNGVEPVRAADGAAFRAVHAISADAPVVVCVGRMQPIKGHANLLRAWPAVLQEHPGARLVFVGRGREMSATVELAKNLGVESSVTFVGALEDVSPAYRAADIQVLPSLGEGLPYTLLEGMTAGLPIVATRVGGVPECVEHEVTGLLVPPSDSPALAAALSRLLADPGMRERMGSAGMRASSEFSVDLMATRVADIYRELSSR